MRIFHIILIIFAGNVIAFSPIEREMTAMEKGYSKQTLRSVEIMRRLFKLPKGTPIEVILQYYNKYNVDATDVIPYWKRSSLESIGKNTALTENSPMQRKKKAMDQGYPKQVMRSAQKKRRLLNLPKTKSVEDLLQYWKKYQDLHRRQENEIRYLKRSTLESIGKNSALTIGDIPHFKRSTLDSIGKNSALTILERY